MSKTGNANGSFWGNFIYDQLLQCWPHFHYELSRAMDFSFVKEALKDFYVDWGRDPWDPVLMFKMVFLQFLYDLSDRDVEEQCTWNLLFESFLGLSAEELPPDHTMLCRFRQRLGAEGFQRLFNQVVEQARSRGFITDRLHIIDSTHIVARVDLFRLKKKHKGKGGDGDDHYVDRHSPDPDARFGRKTPKKGFYGYKCHVVQDADSEFIVQALTTSGNVPDGTALPVLAQPQAKELSGDKAYDRKANHYQGPGCRGWPVSPLPPIWATPQVLAGAPQDREKIRGVQAVPRLASSPLLGAGQSGHPNLNGGPGGEPQTLAHPLKAAQSGLHLRICGLVLKEQLVTSKMPHPSIKGEDFT